MQERGLYFTPSEQTPMEIGTTTSNWAKLGARAVAKYGERNRFVFYMR